MHQYELWYPGTAEAVRAPEEKRRSPRPADRPLAEAPPPAPRSRDELAAWLGRRLGRPVGLTLTKNRSTMISYRTVDNRPTGELRLRLHERFRDSEVMVLEAVVAYVATSDRQAARLLDRFIGSFGASDHPRPVATQPRGRFFDLEEILTELNQTFFHGRCTAAITWGTSARRRYRRSIQLGCYARDSNLIRIHPCLDQAFVPRFYLGWIVFHEMLHEVYGVEEHGPRRRVHPPEFVALEETYPDHIRAKTWESDHLHRLLRYRGSGAR